jgi:hypothetical protein
MTTLPVAFRWTQIGIVDDDGVVSRQFVMMPLPRFLKLAARQFSEGEEYPLVPVESRNMRSHNAYFAQIGDAFDNLPETISARFPSEMHLRKWALVEIGIFDEREIDCASEAAAQSTALLMRDLDEYCRISIHGRKVIVRRAKSQSLSAMGKDEFEKSKRAVLELLESMIGVRPGTLKQNAGRHA